MAAKTRVATSESRVNFEGMWQTWPARRRGEARHVPSLLGDKRTRKLFSDRRYLPNVIARIRASHQLRGWRSNVAPPLARPPRRHTRRQQIAAELGSVLSTCTLAQARWIVSGCNNLEKQTMLNAFFSLPQWHSSRLGQELPPALRKVGR